MIFLKAQWLNFIIPNIYIVINLTVNFYQTQAFHVEIDSFMYKREAWKQGSGITIADCWRHAGN